MRKYIILTTLLLAALPLCAQENNNGKKKRTVDPDQEFFHLPDSVTDEYLDNANLPKLAKINDYWLIGVHGGVSVEYGWYNPPRQVHFYPRMPVYGFSVTRFATMMNTFPNLGMELGFQHNYEGYKLKEYETETTSGKKVIVKNNVDGYHEAYLEVPEVFLLTHGHVDFGRFVKVNLKAGMFAGYRMNITRIRDSKFIPEDDSEFEVNNYAQYANSFRETDNRWTYGFQGGAGLGLMLDPIEFHLGVQIKWGWSPFYPPDVYSRYRYSYIYPMDATVTFGVYYQLTKRRGHTRSSLRRMARQYATEERNPEINQ